MIDLKPLKEEAVKFPDPLKSIIQLSKDSMTEQEFLTEFLKWRKKAREIDQKEGYEK